MPAKNSIAGMARSYMQFPASWREHFLKFLNVLLNNEVIM